MQSPIIVTGLGRSGTTLLHELLACDPDNRPAAPVGVGAHRAGSRSGTPKGEITVPAGTDWAELMDAEITLMDAMVPAFTAMHENGGHLPTECIFPFAHQFSSDMFTGI